MRTSQNNILTDCYNSGYHAREMSKDRYKDNPYTLKDRKTAWECGWVVRNQELNESQNKRVDKG